MKTLALLLLLSLLFAPAHTFAIDFKITEVLIEAQLQENGSASVTEHHTYQFDSVFNGITRQIKPKKGTSISDFSAREGTQQLRVEQEGQLFKIYRSGADETVAIQLSYTINNAVKKSEDGAQFYWPFFDKRNENAYKDMTIIISPPAAAKDIHFLGYGAAYGTAKRSPDGSVTFRLGEVSAGENGDVRVVYKPELFPSLNVQPGTVIDDLRGDQKRLATEAAAFEENRSKAGIVGTVVLPIAGLLLISLFGIAFWNRRRHRQNLGRQEFPAIVPEEEISIPAAIYFTRSPFLGPNAMAAALIELVRKGLVRQYTEESYELISRKTEMPHETTLICLLFDRIGNGTHFQLTDIERYTRKTQNHLLYNDSISDWNDQVAYEVKQKNLYEKRPGLRWAAGSLCAVLAALAGYTGYYGFYGLMVLSAFGAAAALAFVVFYAPLSAQGHRIKANWKRLYQAMKKLPAERWDDLQQNDRMRAYAYFLGSDSKNMNKQTAVLALSENRANQLDNDGIYLNILLLTGIFMAASSNASAEAGSSSSFSAGGGVGGGGGGSGAF